MYFIIDAVSSVLRMCEKTKGNVEMKKRRCNLVRNRIYKAERMVYGDDMDVSINSDRIVCARFFSAWEYEKDTLDGEYNDGYVETEDIPIEEDQWAAIEKAVMSVTDLLEEIPDKSSESPFGESDEMFVTD